MTKRRFRIRARRREAQRRERRTARLLGCAERWTLIGRGNEAREILARGEDLDGHHQMMFLTSPLVINTRGRRVNVKNIHVVAMKTCHVGIMVDCVEKVGELEP